MTFLFYPPFTSVCRIGKPDLLPFLKEQVRSLIEQLRLSPGKVTHVPPMSLVVTEPVVRAAVVSCFFDVV